MIKIRRGTFETNSSSTHSITICNKDMYDKFVNGEDIYIDFWGNKLITKEEALEKLDKYNEYRKNHNTKPVTLEEYVNDPGSDVMTFETYNSYIEDSECYETFKEEFTTPSGDTVYCFGYYGYDG